MYWPTFGSVSIFILPRGKRPFLFAIAEASELKDAALRRHKPIGFKNDCSSASLAEAKAFHDGKCRMKDGKKAATVSARVLWSRTSLTTLTY